MKKTILLIALFGAALMTNAQRVCDASLSLKSPANGQQIKMNNSFNLSFTLKNNGPDDWKASVDTALTAITYNGTVIQSLVQQVTFNKLFKAGDSITFNLNNLQINGQAAGTFTFCAIGSVRNRSLTDSISDNNLANNSSCNDVEFLDNTGVGDGVFSIDYVKPSIYPNPSNGNAAVSFGLSAQENVNLTIYDMNGRVVKEVLNEKLIPGAYVNYLQADDFKSGVYMVTLRTSEFSRTSKMVITK